MLLLCSASSVQARCRAFIAEQELPRIPIIIEGLVTASNNEAGELSACAGQKDCLYQATIQVERVLKGSHEPQSFTVEYPYWQGCPGVVTFTKGERRYFFLSEVGTLYGKSCGFSGAALNGATATAIQEHVR